MTVRQIALNGLHYWQMRRCVTILLKFFKDRNGRIAILQTPNIPLTGWALFIVSTHILRTESWQQFASIMSFGFIFAWSFLEITEGASYFRRALGLVILVVSIYSRLN